MSVFAIWPAPARTLYARRGPGRGKRPAREGVRLTTRPDLSAAQECRKDGANHDACKTRTGCHDVLHGARPSCLEERKETSGLLNRVLVGLV
jgi:hypothetical protein